MIMIQLRQHLLCEAAPPSPPLMLLLCAQRLNPTEVQQVISGLEAP